MKFWITRYALSGGIQEIDELELAACDSKRSYASGLDSDGQRHFHLIGTDAHYTKEDAIKRAESMRLKKIASVKKTLAKLEAMRFS